VKLGTFAGRKEKKNLCGEKRKRGGTQGSKRRRRDCQYPFCKQWIVLRKKEKIRDGPKCKSDAKKACRPRGEREIVEKTAAEASDKKKRGGSRSREDKVCPKSVRGGRTETQYGD